MSINTIKINNLGSFINFYNDVEFKNRNIIFGTNGSGKSTLTSLLYYLDRYKIKADHASENELLEFFEKKISKEGNDQISIELLFGNKQETIEYNKTFKQISTSNIEWQPIKVFNEEYTNLNIGEKIDVNLPRSGITIGEVNIDLEDAKKEKVELLKKIENLEKEAAVKVDLLKERYKALTRSSGHIEKVITQENLLADSCVYQQNSNLIAQRENLGHGQIDNILEPIYVANFRSSINDEDAENICNEEITMPELDENIGKILKGYTSFFKSGITIYAEDKNTNCPFCMREWEDAEGIIKKYKEYLESEYNQKRENIKSLISDLENYKNAINKYKSNNNSKATLVLSEAAKYQVDVSNWKNIEYDELKHKNILDLFNEKYINMNKCISIKDMLIELENSHLKIVNDNNLIIKNIATAIEEISNSRRKVNSELAKHFMREGWDEFNNTRDALSIAKTELGLLKTRIQQLEEETTSTDAIVVVFNELLNFVGLDEYFLTEDRKLHLKLDLEHDISSEGKRVSSAQRKILALCYFFAEIVSKVSDIKTLKKYILIFDDPVDSADYIFFHTITTIIEKCEILLSKILEQENVKFGQFFVFTHNSLLYDRLSAKWANHKKSLKKIDQITQLCKAENKINDYNIYLDEIVKYYKNPNSSKKRMIFIGNIIRRVLEILASFDTLNSNNFDIILTGLGKPKLALIANHLSHESFTKVLNPMANAEELQQACKDILDLIKDRHPHQYLTLVSMYDLEPIN